MARSKIVLLLATLACLGLSSVSDRINPYFFDVILGIGINIILAVSLNLINGYTGQFSLGHAGFMAVGAYSAAWLTTTAGPKLLPWLGGAQSLLAGPVLFSAGLLAGGILAGLAGLLVGLPCLRLKGDYLAIATLGFGEIIRVILNNMDSVGGSRGFTGIPPYTNFFWTFFLASLATYVVVNLVNSTYGRGFIAVQDDEVAAEAMGINSTNYKVTAFVIGAFFAGIAGGLYGHFKQFLVPEGFNFMKSIEIVVMVILGGMGSTVGVIAAAILLTVFAEVSRSFGDYRMIFYSLLLVVLMLSCPKGLTQVWQSLLGIWSKTKKA